MAAATSRTCSIAQGLFCLQRIALPCLAVIMLLTLSPALFAGSGALQVQDDKTTKQDPEKKSAIKKAIDKTRSAIERRREKILKGRVDETEERPDRPTFSNRAKKTGGIQDVTFDDIKFEMEKTERFKRDMLTDEIRAMDGTRISLRGYIKPGNRQTNLSKFVFVRDNQECCFGPGAALFDCVLVKLAKGSKSDFTVRPVTVEGDFYVKEYRGPNGQIWAVYRMKNGVVK